MTLSRCLYLQSNTLSLPPRAAQKKVPKCLVRNQFYLYTFRRRHTWYRDTQTLPVIGTDVEQAPGCPPEFFNLTLSMNIFMSDPFVSLPGYKLQLLAGL